MSLWLKTRLLSLLCGALLVGGATYLHAQEDYWPPSKTPEEAATNFWKLLAFVHEPQQQIRYQMVRGETNRKSFQALIGSITRPQYEGFGRGGRNYRTDPLGLVATEAFESTFEGQVQNSSGSQTIVSIAPPTAPKAREVVVVGEEGGYRVDVVATYGRWHHLSGLDADRALFKATGWISPKLLALPGFVGSETMAQCQTQLKQMGIAVFQYAQDYDERLPSARRWQDGLAPYLKSEALYTCPALLAKAKQGGYAFNSNLSQITLGRLDMPAQTVQFYETSNLKRNVFAPFTGRAYRHSSYNVGNGINIAFSDGHVKWYESGAERSLNVTPDGKNMFGAG